jgi:hypothetical protein
MPLISDLLIKKEPNKRFKKIPYRPWDNEQSSSSPQEAVKDSSLELLSSGNKAFDANEKTTDPAINKTSSGVSSTAILLSSPEIHQFSEQSLEKEFRGLFGAQKIILQHLLTLGEERIDEYVITKSISMDEFALACQLPPNTIKTMLQKLKHKNLILRYENKPGRGGYARYRIIKIVYDFFVEKYFHNQA